MDLDDETLEQLGFGRQRVYEAEAIGVEIRRIKVRGYWNAYTKTSKGKAARKRYRQGAAYKASRKRYSKTPEQRAKRNARDAKKRREDARFRAKAAARALAYYHRNKVEIALKRNKRKTA